MKNKKCCQISVYLSKQDNDDLNRMCEKEGVSRSEYVRRAFDAWEAAHVDEINKAVNDKILSQLNLLIEMVA